MHPELIQEVLDLIGDRESEANNGQLVEWTRSAWMANHGALEELFSPEEVAAEVRPHLTALRRRLSAQVRGFEADDAGSIFWMDEVLARYLEGIGPESAKAARGLREAAEAPWEEALAEDQLVSAMGLWTGATPSFIYYLVWAVLHDVLLPWKETLGRRQGPALSHAVVLALHATLWTKDRKLVPDGDALSVCVNGHAVAKVRALPGDMSHEEWLRVTRGVAAHRVLRWLVAEALRQRVAGETRGGDLVVVRVAGGFEGLARALRLNAKSGKVRKELKDVLDALAAVAIRLPRMGDYNLCSWQRDSRTGGLRITVDALLAPDFVFGIGKGPGERAGRRLVPFPGDLPPLIGRERDHASQVVLQQLLLRELRTRATDIVARGYVTISDERWRELANEADLPVALLAGVRHAWSAGTESTSPFISTTPEGGVTLVEGYEMELGMLREAGQMELRGRRNALRSFRSKRASGSKP